MKPAFVHILGNLALRERFRDDILDGTLSHAYIIEGEKGSGKHLFAKELAAALSCERKDEDGVPLPCYECPSCRKILSGNSPDLIYINRGGRATISVEAIRDLRMDTAVAPNDVDVKLYVIEEANLLTIPAQNALLLTLEEPPPYVLFLLLCDSADTLLETIRSRAPLFRTEPVATVEVEKRVKDLLPEARSLAQNDPASFAELIFSAGGSIGRALSLFDTGEQKALLARRELTRRFLRLVTSPKDVSASLDFLASLPQKREELIEQFRTLALALSDMAALKRAENPPLCFFPEKEEGERFAYALPLKTILGLIALLSDTSENIGKNANIRLALTFFAVRAGLL